jgi:hypothetical protein
MSYYCPPVFFVSFRHILWIYAHSIKMADGQNCHNLICRIPPPWICTITPHPIQTWVSNPNLAPVVSAPMVKFSDGGGHYMGNKQNSQVI